MTTKLLRPAIMALAFILSCFLAAQAETEFFELEDIRPGMKGIGKTCFQGTQPEEFEVEILGVLRGVSPGTDAVLARFSGGLLDRVGIFEGMSGSPVYIDGKLLGAIAFSFSFAKEAIGGINPITQMVEAFKETAEPSAGGKVIFKKSQLWNYRLREPAELSDYTDIFIAPNNSRFQPLTAPLGRHSLVPIATPLSLGGFDANTLKVFEPQFRKMGMSVLQGAGGVNPAASGKVAGKSDKPTLVPGSNIVVPLVRGDLDVSAGGTVTHVDGNRLYAFGHSMLDLGFTELPMHNGTAITVFPSLQSSFKILEMGDAVGAIRQDRGMGIYGVLGENPRMVPLEVNLTTSRRVKRVLRYELARDPFLTPLLVNLTLYNSIVASERALGVVTLQIKGTIGIKGEPSVELYNRFSTDSGAPNSASLSIAVPLNYIMAAGYENLDLENIKVDISVQEDDRAAILDSIRLSSAEVKAGEFYEMEVTCRKANGEAIRETYPVKIPENISPGALTLLVADGTTIMSMDDREEKDILVPRDLTQLIKYINNLRKNDHMYLRFYRQQSGAVIKGEGLPGLPPSILSILKSERKAGAMSPIRRATLMEYELPTTEYVVSGAKSLNLEVKP
jgi:hypothetical protein